MPHLPAVLTAATGAIGRVPTAPPPRRHFSAHADRERRTLRVMSDSSATPPPPPSDPPGQTPYPPSAPVDPGPGGGHTISLDLVAPLEVANWRPLVHWLLVIPYAIVAGILTWVLGIASFIAFFTVLFTKRIPKGLFDFMTMALRASWRANSYQFFLREPYPEFEFATTTADPGGDPATLSIDEPEELNRWLPLVKWLLAVPHYVVLFFLAIGLWFVLLIGFFAVLFTGRWPQGLRDYVVGVNRWGTRVIAYVYLMTDEYPPFSLE